MTSLAQNIKIKAKALILSRLASKRRHHWNPKNISSILVVRYDRIGDMVVSTPLFRALRRLYPAIIIDVLASSQNAVVLDSNGDVSAVKIYPRSLVGKVYTLATLRGRYDLVIDLNHSLIWQTIIELQVLGPRWIICPKKGSRYKLNPEVLTLYDRMGTLEPKIPISLLYLDLINLLNPLERTRLSPDYYVPLGVKQEHNALTKLSTLTPPFYGVNLYGGRNSMCLRKDDFRLIAETIFEIESGGTILLFSTPNRFDETQDLTRQVPRYEKRVVALPPTASVMDAVAFISKLKILVTPDTSLVHFACAKEIPLVAVYANEQALYCHWQPRSKAPFRVCFSADSKALKGYLIKEVIEAIREVLGNVNSRQFAHQINEKA
jgi:ADP-heptose:LPS heptosyltransferase